MVRQGPKISFWQMIVFEIRFCFKNCPAMMAAETIASVLHGISYVFIIYMTQFFFDIVADAVDQNKKFSEVIVWALALGGLFILNQIINGGENYLYSVLYKKLKGYSYLNLFKKSCKLKAELFESPEFLDELSKAKEGAEYFNLPLFPIIGLSTFYLAYFFGMGWYIFSLQPILAVSIVMVFIPSFVGQYLKTYLFSKLADESVKYRRKFEYYEECICGKDYLKETRTLSAIPLFGKLYKEALEILTLKSWNTNKKAARIAILVRLVTLAGYLGILVLFVEELLKGNISIGMFAAVYVSIGKMFSMMDEVVDTISGLTQNLGLMKNYMAFLDYPQEEGSDISINLNEKLELKNVTYRYKGAEIDTLNNINLSIKAGETVAIVGENGSGKTTLVKLISGLFLPTGGQVFYDGVDISKAKATAVHHNVSIVCQNFIRYKMTARRNICISKDLENMESTSKDEEIKSLLKQVGLNLNQKEFSKGLDTMLSREFDGEDLSGGQWQRIAIARGVFRPHKMIILDEPTAAIDPIEESNLFQLFGKLSEDKTSIIVTHRLGCVKIADRIIVMNKGKILEMGTHSELLQIGGKYSEMYNAQAQWYSR